MSDAASRTPIENRQRERMARRLKALYIAEMSGQGSVDKLYRKLEKLHAKIKQHAAAVKASSVATLS